MKTRARTERIKKDWVLNKWWEKVIYVLGILSAIYYALCFIAGFVAGMAGI